MLSRAFRSIVPCTVFCFVFHWVACASWDLLRTRVFFFAVEGVFSLRMCVLHLFGRAAFASCDITGVVSARNIARFKNEYS